MYVLSRILRIRCASEACVYVLCCALLTKKRNVLRYRFSSRTSTLHTARWFSHTHDTIYKYVPRPVVGFLLFTRAFSNAVCFCVRAHAFKYTILSKNIFTRAKTKMCVCRYLLYIMYSFRWKFLHLIIFL